MKNQMLIVVGVVMGGFMSYQHVFTLVSTQNALNKELSSRKISNSFYLMFIRDPSQLGTKCSNQK